MNFDAELSKLHAQLTRLQKDQASFARKAWKFYEAVKEEKRRTITLREETKNAVREWLTGRGYL